MGFQKRKGQLEQGRERCFPEKVILELAFKGKWKFLEAQRGCGKRMAALWGHCKGTSQILKSSILAEPTTHYSATVFMNVLYKL